MKKRRKFTAEFKSKVALARLSLFGVILINLDVLMGAEGSKVGTT